MTNIYNAFLKLLPARPRQVGTILAFDGDTATVELPGGGIVTALGAGSVGDQVFVRDGVIEAGAPGYPVTVIEVGA